MRKPKKPVIHATPIPRLIEDPDDVQLLDECNSQWAEAWKAAAKESTELKAQIIIPENMRLTTRDRKNPTLKNNDKRSL
jgi:hypothetical protein